MCILSQFYHFMRSRPQRAERITVTEVKTVIYSTIPSSPTKTTLLHFLSVRQPTGKCVCL